MQQTSRDDFIIAVRSAFLKKDNKQRFSLIVLIFISIFFLFLETISFKPIDYLRTTTKDIIYRSSYIISLPEKFISYSYKTIRGHFALYSEHEILKNELISLQSQKYETKYLEAENERLFKIVEDLNYSMTGDVARVLLDRESPFLRSVIINRGSKNKMKKGMAVLDGKFLIGKIAEVNFISSRVLLVSDLNSKVPISIEPSGTQGILSGTGDKHGIIEYSKEKLDLENGSIAFTSGAGDLFKPGIPVGEIIIEDGKYRIKFFSDFSQIKYVNILDYQKQEY